MRNYFHTAGIRSRVTCSRRRDRERWTNRAISFYTFGSVDGRLQRQRNRRRGRLYGLERQFWDDAWTRLCDRRSRNPVPRAGGDRCDVLFVIAAGDKTTGEYLEPYSIRRVFFWKVINTSNHKVLGNRCGSQTQMRAGKDEFLGSAGVRKYFVHGPANVGVARRRRRRFARGRR